jgi:hypothetical protein
MERADYLIIAGGVVVALALIPVMGPSTWALAVLADVAACTGVIGVRRLPRKPVLIVLYRNEARRDREPTLTIDRNAPNQSHALTVYVRNDGKGEAEAVEVLFDNAQAPNLWNCSGNFNTDVDGTVFPHRFKAPGRVLPGGGHEWCLARLSWHPSQWPVEGVATWQAFAKGMKPREGVVRIRVEDLTPPPPPWVPR